MNLNTPNKIKEDYQSSRNIWRESFKRCFDILGSLLILLFIAPILVVISILILVLDGRPVLFKQKRTGKDGIDFDIFKFKTMKKITADDIEKNRLKYDWENGVPENFVFKGSYNPNITKIGYFLRKFSLDELPQFLNVLNGKMSIVGPRPEIPEITSRYSKHQELRLLVKPGITGYAQINGRSEMSHGDKIKYDLYYVNNQSVKLDLKIFFITIYQSLSGKGAY
ncbi:glycosyl transferase [Bacillaceae bacterium JMAK1]|nr:glycosyl transferase [Bacillaceae bacterium JMAK1]